MNEDDIKREEQVLQAQPQEEGKSPPTQVVLMTRFRAEVKGEDVVSWRDQAKKAEPVKSKNNFDVFSGLQGG